MLSILIGLKSGNPQRARFTRWVAAYSEGSRLKNTIVNGKIILEDNELTDERGGTVIRGILANLETFAQKFRLLKLLLSLNLFIDSEGESLASSNSILY